VVAGAGSAGAGALNFIRNTMMDKYGMTKEEANQRFYVLDKDGLISQDRGNIEELESNFDNIRDYARSETDLEGSSLEKVVAEVKPTVLIGLSAVGGIFSEKIIKKMHEHCERPIVFALSNPTSRSEAKADGNVLIVRCLEMDQRERCIRLWKPLQRCNYWQAINQIFSMQ